MKIFINVTKMMKLINRCIKYNNTRMDVYNDKRNCKINNILVMDMTWKQLNMLRK